MLTVALVIGLSNTSGAASIESLPLTKAAPGLLQGGTNGPSKQGTGTIPHVQQASLGVMVQDVSQRWPTDGLDAVLLVQHRTQVSATRRLARVDRCSARKAARYYRARYVYWLDKMGATARRVGSRDERSSVGSCPRYLSRVLQRKAHAARAAFERWHRYHFAWREWMPAKHQRVAQCETGYQGGTGPGGSRWDWDSGTYVSAFGIYRTGYDDDAHRVGNLGWDETLRKLGRYPTPREQMQAADSHRAAHGGWSGWGCRGA